MYAALSYLSCLVVVHFFLFFDIHFFLEGGASLELLEGLVLPGKFEVYLLFSTTVRILTLMRCQALPPSTPRVRPALRQVALFIFKKERKPFHAASESF